MYGNHGQYVTSTAGACHTSLEVKSPAKRFQNMYKIQPFGHIEEAWQTKLHGTPEENLSHDIDPSEPQNYLSKSWESVFQEPPSRRFPQDWVPGEAGSYISGERKRNRQGILSKLEIQAHPAEHASPTTIGYQPCQRIQDEVYLHSACDLTQQDFQGRQMNPGQQGTTPIDFLDASKHDQSCGHLNFNGLEMDEVDDLTAAERNTMNHMMLSKGLENSHSIWDLGLNMDGQELLNKLNSDSLNDYARNRADSQSSACELKFEPNHDQSHEHPYNALFDIRKPPHLSYENTGGYETQGNTLHPVEYYNHSNILEEPWKQLTTSVPFTSSRPVPQSPGWKMKVDYMKDSHMAWESNQVVEFNDRSVAGSKKIVFMPTPRAPHTLANDPSERVDKNDIPLSAISYQDPVSTYTFGPFRAHIFQEANGESPGQISDSRTSECPGSMRTNNGGYPQGVESHHSPRDLSPNGETFQESLNTNSLGIQKVSPETCRGKQKVHTQENFKSNLFRKEQFIPNRNIQGDSKAFLHEYRSKVDTKRRLQTKIRGNMDSFSNEHCVARLRNIGYKIIPISLKESLERWFEVFGIELLMNQKVRDMFSIEKLAYVMRRAFVDVAVGFLAVIILLNTGEKDLKNFAPTQHSAWFFLREKFLKWGEIDFQTFDIHKKINFGSIDSAVTDPDFILQHLFNIPNSSRVPLTLHWGLWSEWNHSTLNFKDYKNRGSRIDFNSQIKAKIAAWDPQGQNILIP